MKCPKCGYISFDYNQVCPKCNKDISTEQKRLNLPDYKPSFPALLGALTGGVNEDQGRSQDHGMALGLDSEGAERIGQAGEMNVTNDFAGSDILDGENEIDPIEPVTDYQFEDIGNDKPRQSAEQKDAEAPSIIEKSEFQAEALSFDLEDLALDEKGKNIAGSEESILQEDDELSLDLDSLLLDESSSEVDAEQDDLTFSDTDMITMVIDNEDKDDMDMGDFQLEPEEPETK